MKFYKKDVSSFVSKLTISKLWNALLIFSSYHLTRIIKIPVQWGQPFTLSFEPTTACNLKCPECPSGLRSFTRPTGNLKSDFFKKTIDQVAEKLFYLIFYFQGEPYINPEFLDMVQYAHRKNIYTITSTNGHFLDDHNAKKTIESGLDRIIISIDGTTQEVYQQYRKNGSLNQAIQGTKNLVKWKEKLGASTPHIIYQFLVVKPNQHQIPEVYKLAKELGVDEVNLKTAQVYDYELGNPLIPTINRYSRYEETNNGSWKLKNTLENRCWKLWHSGVITWDGKVVPCCFDKDARHIMGDLRKQDFDKIWDGLSYQKFRNKLIKGRNTIDICTNCTEGCRVFS